MIRVIIILLLSGCGGEGGLWRTQIGASVFDGFFGGSGEEKKEEIIPPIITYNTLKDNLPAVDSADFSYPLHKIQVGDPVLNSLVPSIDFEPGKPLDGKELEIYNTVTSTGILDLSSIAGDGGDIDFPKPGEVPLPFSDLNRNPLVANPFTSLEAIPKAPPTEFFFDEIQKKPQFFD